MEPLRPFDEYLKPVLSVLRKVRMTANALTAARVIILPAFFAAVEGLPFLLPLLCLLDGFLDIADGAFARVFKQRSPWGAYSDQGSDKVSNWSRLFVLVPVSTLSVDSYIADYSLFWMCMLVALFCDIINLSIRTVEFGRTKLIGQRAEDHPAAYGSASVGKVKTWAQQLGIALLAIGYSYEHHDGGLLPLYISVGLTGLGVIALIPPRPCGRLRDTRWLSLAALLTAVTVGSCLHARTGTAMAQFALAAALVCAVLSTKAQLTALWRYARL